MATLIVLVLLAAAVICAVRYVVGKMKKGECAGCSGGCPGCRSGRRPKEERRSV